jgi:hypothetical protein
MVLFSLIHAGLVSTNRRTPRPPQTKGKTKVTSKNERMSMKFIDDLYQIEAEQENVTIH